MRQIRIRYRKILNSQRKNDWDRMVWEDSFTEFRMQSQRFNPDGRHFTFGALLTGAPEAEQLHFLVGGSVLGYLGQLNGIIPDVVDILGQRFLRIADCRFEIINSDLRDIARHEVAFNFYSEPLLWHDTVDKQLLVSPAKSAVVQESEDIYDTHLFELRHHVSIDKFSEVT